MTKTAEQISDRACAFEYVAAHMDIREMRAALANWNSFVATKLSPRQQLCSNDFHREICDRVELHNSTPRGYARHNDGTLYCNHE